MKNQFIFLLILILSNSVIATHEKAIACAGCLLSVAGGCLFQCGPPVPTPVWAACEGNCLAWAAAGACRPLCGGG